jgi:hypothetical protein
VKSTDPVLLALERLPQLEPPGAVSARLSSEARARLLPRPIHPIFGLAVAASTLAYLSWALFYTGQF